MVKECPVEVVSFSNSETGEALEKEVTDGEQQKINLYDKNPE